MVFWRFQGVQKCDIGLKWVDKTGKTYIYYRRKSLTETETLS